MGDVMAEGELAIERVEPLHEHVYVNALHLNMHYMNASAIIPNMGQTHDKIISCLDRWFIFLSKSLDFSRLKDWFIQMNESSKIDQYKGGKWLWLGKYQISSVAIKSLYNINNLLFISGLE